MARYEGPVDGGAQARAIAVAGRGSVYVTGFSYRSTDPFPTNYATVAYAVDTGDELWVAQYIGPAGDDVASAMAVDATGTVYVTGLSRRDPTNSDYLTVAYSQP
jgi:hypothetical protein